MDEFDSYRAEMNERLLAGNHRIDRLDTLLEAEVQQPVGEHNHE